MELSSYEQPLPPARARYAASSHLSDGTGGDGKWHLYPEMAAAGLWTNPTELARLAMELRAAYHGRRDRVLSPTMTNAMFTPGLGGWGLGFTIRGEGDEARFSHGGSNYGFRAQFLAFMEEGRGVFVMTNADQGSALAQEIVLSVAEAYGWPVPQPQEVILAAISREILEQIAGEYRIEGQDLGLTVTVVEDHIRIDVPEADVYKITKTIYENLGFLQSIHKATNAMALEKAIVGLPMPLHPGAVRYYKEAGLEIPARLIVD